MMMADVGEILLVQKFKWDLYMYKLFSKKAF